MRRFWLFLWFFLPILGHFSMTSAALFGQNTTDSLQFFINNKDARNVLIQANQLVHDDPDRAVFGFQQAYKLARMDGEHGVAGAVLRDQGLFYEELNRLDSAFVLYDKARILADSLANPEAQMIVYNDLAILSRKLERYKLSKKYHFTALEIAQKVGDAETVEFSWHGLGALYEAVGDSTQALYYYEESQKVANKRQSITGQLITLQNIARTFTGLKRQTEAEANIGIALRLGEKQPDTLEYANVLLVAGDVSTAFQKNEAALAYYQKSRFFYEKMHEFGEAVGVQMKEAALLANLRRNEEALAAYRACATRPSVLPPDNLAAIFLETAKLLTQKPQATESQKLFFESLRICENNQLMEQSIHTLRGLHDFFSKQNNPKKALLYLKSAENRNDSLATFFAERANLALQFRYDQEQNERSLQSLQLRRNRMAMLGFLIGGLSLVGFLVWMIRLRRRANAALKAKNLEIEAQNVRLTESNSFLQQFTYAVAHDLKAPLRTVGSFITILEKKFGSQFPDQAHEYMNFVTLGVKRMDSLIQDLLEYSKISSQRPGTELIDPKSTLEEVKKRLHAIILQKKGVIEMAENMPSVRFERSHLVLLFQHLIENGLKFNESDAPNVKIGGKKTDGHVQYFFEDNGIGIDPAHGLKIFELFHQLNKNKGFDGTGIGLTVCKNIIDKYEGKIWLEPVVGTSGTRFWVEFLG
jgi:signal transduction histidine kinase